MLRPLLLAAAGATAAAAARATAGDGVHIFYVNDAHRFPAHELRRYAYLLANRTGPLLGVEQVATAERLAARLAATKHAIVLFAPDEAVASAGIADVLTAGGARAAVQRQLDLCTLAPSQQSQPVAGGDDAAAAATPLAFAAHTFPEAQLTLVTSSAASTAASSVSASATTNMQHAVYTVLERWGARFDLHGDVLPDFSPSNTHAPAAPSVMELIGRLAVVPAANAATFAVTAAEPQFAYRGLQPFHDFPEGPDWWNENQYRHVMTQLAKQKMNFLGLHTYPFKAGTPGTGTDEPTVWVGGEACLHDDGTVREECAYETSYANSLRGEWGYAALPTGNYSWGSDRLFDADCWGSYPGFEVSCPAPPTASDAAALFEATADMLEGAFSFGATLGVEGCVGTETPLSFPLPPPPACTADATGAAGVCLQDTATRVFPTTVSIKDSRNTWEWCAGQCALLNHSVAAVEFGVACFCGEPADVAAATHLPRDECAAMKCAGNATEDCGASYIMLAYNFTCAPDANPESNSNSDTPPTTEEIYRGIFTRLLKRVPSLAWYWIWTPEQWEWSKVTVHDPAFQASLADLASAVAAKEALGAPWKMATNGWVVGPLPDRTIYDKALPEGDWSAIGSIDMNTGHSPVDPSYANITHHAKWVIPWMEDDPDLTAPQLWVNRTLKHMEDAATYNCSGLLGIHWRTRAVSPQIAAMAQKSWDWGLTSQAFWADWVHAQFGLAPGTPAGAAATAAFAAVDSFAMPLVVAWTNGPGQMAAKCYDTTQLTALRAALRGVAGNVTGAVNADRFAYWQQTFEYMFGVATTSCAWAEYNSVATAVARAPAVQQKQLAEVEALPARERLIANATAMMRALQATLSTPGELGTYMNIESHSLPSVITEPAAALRGWLGVDVLPPTAVPPPAYDANLPSRVIVPTARTSLGPNETFSVRALVLSTASCEGSSAQVFVAARPLGSATAFATFPLAPLAAGRCVFVGLEAAVATSAPFDDDFEWYVGVNMTSPAPTTAVFPVGAPAAQVMTTLVGK